MTKCMQTQLHTLAKVQKERVEIHGKCKLQEVQSLPHEKEKSQYFQKVWRETVQISVQKRRKNITKERRGEERSV